jgi:hypothetical protein
MTTDVETDTVSRAPGRAEVLGSHARRPRGEQARLWIDPLTPSSQKKQERRAASSARAAEQQAEHAKKVAANQAARAEIREMKKDVPQGYCTREMVLEELGITAGEFQAFVTRGIIRRAKTHYDRKALYTRAGVERVRLEIAKEQEGAALGAPPEETPRTAARTRQFALYEAEESALVVPLLREGMNLGEIVFQLPQVHPNAVEAVARDYARLSGAVVVSSALVEALNKLPLQGDLPFSTGEELFYVVRATLNSQACRTCRRAPGSICRSCADKKVTGRASTSGAAPSGAPSSDPRASSPARRSPPAASGAPSASAAEEAPGRPAPPREP